MKKIISLFLTGLTALMILSLSACGQTQPEPEPRRFELTDVQTMAEEGVFSEDLEQLDADMAFALYHLADYGLTLKDLTDAAVLRSAGATCEEAAVLLFDVDDWDEKVEKAAQALGDYLQSQMDSNVDYRPDEIPKLESALLEARGNRVVLVVANDVEKAKELLEIE